MGSFVSKATETITKKASGEAASMIKKLSGENDSNNVSTISFPSGLENQAQCTYMVIYIFDNNLNSKTFSNQVFNSDIDEGSYEIEAVTWIKDQVNEEVIKPLKSWVKNQKDTLVSTGKDWLKKQKEYLFGSDTNDKTKEISSITHEIKEAVDWVNKWLVPHRKKSESQALIDQLDPSKHPEAGYTLKKAIQIQMPNSPIKYNYENGWETQDTKSYNMIRTFINSIEKLFGSEDENKQGKAGLKAVGKQALLAVEDAITGGGASATHQAEGNFVINPVLVFNYSLPSPRTFTYSFSLYPRNKDELYALYEIVQTLKYYALPAIDTAASKGKGQQGITYNYPAKFAVKFYTNGYENKWFHKTMALGLTNLEESLTGEGGDMAFFENYFDTHSGNPPRMINLTLTFKELGIMSRQYAEAGY